MYMYICIYSLVRVDVCVCVYTCNGTQCKLDDEAEADKENAAEAMRCIEDATHSRKDNEVSQRGS